MTLHGLTFSEAALAGLAKVQPKKVRQQIVNKIKALTNDPLQKGTSKVKGATNGLHPIFRIRSGDYRVLYSVRNETEIIVLDIGHRKDVYRHR